MLIIPSSSSPSSLSIQLREHTGPAALVTQRIPKWFLEATYGIFIPTLPEDEGGTGVPTAEEFLCAYAGR